MSHTEFERRIRQLRNQIHTLLLAKAGKASVHKVKVKAHDVPGYSVQEHTRVIYSRQKKAA